MKIYLLALICTEILYSEQTVGVITYKNRKIEDRHLTNTAPAPAPHIPSASILVDEKPLMSIEVVYSEQTAGVITYKDGEVDRCNLMLLEGEEDLTKLAKSYSAIPAQHRHSTNTTPAPHLHLTKMRKVGLSEMVELVESCRRLNSSQGGDRIVEASFFWTLWNFVEPGTLWCGKNNIADDYHSLGQETEVDKCCRAHDYCPISRDGMKGTYFTTSLCSCDTKFKLCLKALRSQKADKVGNIFFKKLNMKCIQVEEKEDQHLTLVNGNKYK